MVVDRRKNPMELEAVAPGDVFVHVWEHPQNVELIEGDSRARKLDKPQLKTLQAKLKDLTKQLQSSDFYKAMEIIERRTQKLKELDILRNNLRDSDKNPHFDRLEEVETAIRYHRKRIKVIRAKIAPLRRYALQIDRIQKRLAEHDIAIQNEKLYARLRAELMNEVYFFAKQCIERWSSLGYRQEVLLGKKRLLKQVQFEKCVVTEDEIQFKIRVSDLTLLKSVKHHLPLGVRVAELVSEETLNELSAACQRPVTSPHNEDEKDFSNGAYIVIHRVGMNDGLFNYIRLADILVKYNQGDRERYPFPIGVRRGRVAQYGYLDSQPHLMFNGITGSGKTNAIRSILTTFIEFHSPHEMRLFITDLKRGADFINFHGLPHLSGGVITEVDTLEILCWQLVAMMKSRMDTIAKRAQFDIKGYNAVASDESKLARVVVVIDECSAINSLAEKEQAKSIWRALGLLSTQARAAGIHLFLGTQQSFSDAIPKQVRDNITLVLSGRQRTLAGSLGTFGDGRAKNLPAIPGRMYCYDGDLYMVQTPHATHEDIEKAVKVAMQWDSPKPLDLPEDSAVEPEFVFNEETLIDIALESFEGALKGTRIFEVLDNPNVSRSTVLETIKLITANETYTHKGTEYKIVKERNYFKLVPSILENQNTTNAVLEF